MIEERRRERLRAELEDEHVPLPLAGGAGAALLDELTYARFPPVHERIRPRYGAMLTADPCPPLGAHGGRVVEVGQDVEVLRRAADGRAGFLLRAPGCRPSLVVFDSTKEYEATVAALVAAVPGLVVVQRAITAQVRVVARDGVVTWDGTDWSFKPAAARSQRSLLRLLPGADGDLLQALLELCVHWLSAGRVGASIVWWLEGDAPRGLDLSAAAVLDGLSVSDRRSFGPLYSLLGQTDRALVIDAHGRARFLGATLLASADARSMVSPVGGTRHSSARWYSYDHPQALVFVVSEDGPVSVFSDGAADLQLRSVPCGTGFPLDLLELTEPGRVLPCPTCARELLVDVVDFAGWRGGPERLECPVCAGPLVIEAYRAVVRGAYKRPPRPVAGEGGCG